MKINFEDVIDRHPQKPAVITLHGPSLNTHKEKILNLQQNNKIIRFSVNNWFDYFIEPPDYWILSSSEDAFPVRNLFNIIKKHNVPLYFSDEGDFTDKRIIEKELKSEWLVYDQRHWQGKTCLQILTEFKNYYTHNKNFNFNKFGNNSVMWEPPRCYSQSGHSLRGRCCEQNVPARTPIQEWLQNISGHHSHYSTGDTVALHAIAFSILMGCSPIYISGLDLDYNKGYADEKKNDWLEKARSPNAWTPVRKNLENDLNILNASAKKRGIEIFTLNQNSWYNSFKRTSKIL
jgi:hypothetical protein